jgi:hypothetical protein
VATLTGDQGFAVYPFLWAEGPPIGERARSAVPMAEVYGFQMQAVEQLGKR